MADTKISQLEDSALLTGDEFIPIVQPANNPRGNRKVTISDLMDMAPVQSVNGSVGAVTITAASLGALSSGDNISLLTNDVGYISATTKSQFNSILTDGDFLFSDSIIAIANGGTGLTALGTANQLLRVNAGATALEFFTPSYLSGIVSIANGGTGLSTLGTANQQLRVNGAGTALEYFTPSGGSYTFSNGLTESGGTVTLGSLLSGDVNFTFTTPYNFTFGSSTSSEYMGNFTIYGNTLYFRSNNVGGSAVELYSGSGSTYQTINDSGIGLSTDGIIGITATDGTTYVNLEQTSSNFSSKYFFSSVTNGETYEANIENGSQGVVSKWSGDIGATGTYTLSKHGWGLDTETGVYGFHIYSNGTNYGSSPSDSDLRFRIRSSGEVTLNLGSDATGDIYRRNSSGYLSRLALGSALQVLRVNSGGTDIEWAAPSGSISGSGTTNELTYWTGSSAIGSLSTATYPSLTELSYVKGLTSSAQTQITAREVLTNKAASFATLNNDLYPTTQALFQQRSVTAADSIVAADTGKTIVFNSATPIDFTIDTLTAGVQVAFINKGVGTVTFLQGTGVTLTGTSSLATDETAAIIYYTSSTAEVFSGGGGSGSYTFSNGLTESGGTVKWNGELTEDVYIDNPFGVFFGVTSRINAFTAKVINGFEFDLDDATNKINITGSGSNLSASSGDAVGVDGSISLSAYGGSLNVYGYRDATVGLYGLGGSGTKSLTVNNTNGIALTLGSDATNDMYYRNSSGYLSRIAAGTNGYVLTSSSGVPTWAAPSGGVSGLTTNELVYGNSATTIASLPVATYPSLTELSYVKGLTSSAQTQLNSKLNLAGDTYTTTTGNGLALTSSTVTSGNLVRLSNTGTAAASNTKTVLNVSSSGANGTSTQTTFGAQFSNTNTGTASTNVGLFTTASGGTTNLALWSLGGARVETSTSGNFSVRSSSGADWWTFDNSRLIYLNSVGGNDRITPTSGTLAFLAANATAIDHYTFTGNNALTATSGTARMMVLSKGITLSSGTTTFKGLEITGTYNITGGTNTAIGLDINHTITAFSAGTHLAFRSTSGKALFGGTSITANTSYDFRGVGSGSDNVFRIANSGNTTLTRVTEDGYYYHDNAPTGNYRERHFEGTSSGTSVSQTIYSSSEISNDQAVTIEVLWTAMDLSSNTSAGGVFYTTWSKSGGTLAKAGDNQLATNNNTGDTFTVSTTDSSGNIQLTISSTGSSGNWKGNAFIKSIIKN